MWNKFYYSCCYCTYCNRYLRFLNGSLIGGGGSLGGFGLLGGFGPPFSLLTMLLTPFVMEIL